MRHPHRPEIRDFMAACILIQSSPDPKGRPIDQGATDTDRSEATWLMEIASDSST
jgi:hypothetical protein